MKRTFQLLLVLYMLFILAACDQQLQKAPASRFILINGNTRTLQELHGQVVLVTFWATSCSACVSEMPLLTKTHKQYQASGYHTLAVAMQHDKLGFVQNFARTRQLPFEIAMDHDGQLAQRWGPVRATPTSFLINRHGQIVQRYVGLIDADHLHASLNQLLAEPVP